MERSLRFRSMQAREQGRSDGGVQFPSLAGPMPMAPYMPFAIWVVVTMRGTPESRMALGAFAAGTTEAGRETDFGCPSTYTVMALTLACQKSA